MSGIQDSGSYGTYFLVGENRHKPVNKSLSTGNYSEETGRW